MQFGIDSLNNISRKIVDRDLKYADTIIIGDNSSGNSFYFIDAANRGFDVTKVTNDIRDQIIKEQLSIQESRRNILI